MAKRVNGFTLLEMMIVIALIAVIAGIAVPAALRSRLAANETTATGALRTLVAAQISYKSSSGTNAYGTLDELASATPPYIDESLTSGTLRGYRLELVSVGAETWDAIAMPITPGTTGNRSYLVDQSGTILFTTDGEHVGLIDPGANGSGASSVSAPTATRRKALKARLKRLRKAVKALQKRLGDRPG